MNIVNKYKLIITFFLIIQIICLFLIKNVIIDTHSVAIFNSSFFYSIFSISFVPYIVFYVLNFQLNKKNKLGQIHQNNNDLQTKSTADSGSDQASLLFDKIPQLFQEFHDLRIIFEKLFSVLSKSIEIVQGVAFIKNTENNQFEIISTFAFYKDDFPKEFEVGEGIPGQVAKTGKFVVISDIPDNYINIVSGLGQSTPKQIIIFPILLNNICISIIEIAVFKKISNAQILKLNDTFLSLGIPIQNIIEKEKIYDK